MYHQYSAQQQYRAQETRRQDYLYTKREKKKKNTPGSRSPALTEFGVRNYRWRRRSIVVPRNRN